MDLYKKLSADITRSPLAKVDVLVGYTPSGVITGYKNRVLLTSETSWTVPPGVTEIRTILIGGGQGGQAGSNGGIGMRGYETPVMNQDPIEVDPSPWLLSFNGEAGDGGNGGANGLGGKVVDTGALNVPKLTYSNFNRWCRCGRFFEWYHRNFGW